MVGESKLKMKLMNVFSKQRSDNDNNYFYLLF